MRQLSQQFLNELKYGYLSGLLNCIKQDRDLDLQIRDNYINLYFKGHSLLKLTEKENLGYAVYMDSEFSGDSVIPAFLANVSDTNALLQQLPFVKKNLQNWGKRSVELEYEQLIVRANNYEPRINTDYLILDRQYARNRNEIDLVAILANQPVRRGHRQAPFSFIEIKYGLNSEIGELAHQLERYHAEIAADPSRFAQEMQIVLEQKASLGLFSFQFEDRPNQSKLRSNQF